VRLMETISDGDTNIMKVKLYPEELGVVDLLLHMEEGKVTMKILVDNEFIKQQFANKLPELQDNLHKQNVQLDKVQIDLNNQESGNTHQNPNQNANPKPKFVGKNHSSLEMESVVPRMTYTEGGISEKRQISVLA